MLPRVLEGGFDVQMHRSVARTRGEDGDGEGVGYVALGGREYVLGCVLLTQCEYDDLDKRCTLCAEKGRECTREDKVWGPRHQPTDDDMPEIISNDEVYLKRYNEFWPDNHCSPRIFISSLSPHVGIPLYKPYLEFERSSNLFRNAILVFMSYQETKSEQYETLEYVGSYYQGVRNSIRSNSMLELVYSDYIMAVYTLVTSHDLPTILVWCTQFCRCLDQLAGVDVSGEELLWIETLWQGVLSSLYYIIRDQWHHCRVWGENSKELQTLLGLGDWALGNCLFAPRYPMTTEVICQKIKSLSINMQFYLDQYLFEKSESLPSGETRYRLHLTVDRIILLMKENPVIDTATTLLYNFAIIVKGMFEEADHDTEASVYHAANRIYHLSLSNINALLIKRSLFWAGLILSRSRSAGIIHPHIVLIIVSDILLRRLQQCANRRWSECEGTGADLVEIMNAADRRRSFDDIWRIPSLFSYNQTLAPWFFGMNLVRFEYTGRGRSLEIIA